MKKVIISTALAALMIVPGVTFASGLTSNQVSCIIALLQAFGVDQSTISIVYADISLTASTTPDTATTTPPVTYVAPESPQLTTEPVQTPGYYEQITSPFDGSPEDVYVPPGAPAEAVPQEPAPSCSFIASSQSYTATENELVIQEWSYTPSDASTTIDGVGDPSKQVPNHAWWTGIPLTPDTSYSYTMEVDTATASTTCTSNIPG